MGQKASPSVVPSITGVAAASVGVVTLGVDAPDAGVAAAGALAEAGALAAPGELAAAGALAAPAPLAPALLEAPVVPSPPPPPPQPVNTRKTPIASNRELDPVNMSYSAQVVTRGIGYSRSLQEQASR
ncbi:hypothetical protein CIC12_12070 [Burkholderia sp. SG-MS1]|nr:hypothetical protein [Paraburkholderia sp. SG-MS1]